MSARLSRREVLGLFLGVPAALAACRRSGSQAPALPDGSLVLRRDRIGHRVRDAGTITPPADAWTETGTVIIGGGVAGLAAGWRLARAGIDDFVVLELDSRPGGTSRSGSSELGAYPWGAHYITAPMKESRAMLTLLDEMAVLEGRDASGEPIVAERYLCRDPQERLFFFGRWYEDLFPEAGASASDRAQRKAFDAEVGRLADWRDARGRRAFAMPSSMSTDDDEILALDRMTMAQWLDDKGFTSPRLRWYVEYGCRDDYGLVLEDTSAWAGLFYHVARVQRSGSEYQPVITWPEGNGRLVRHLAASVGDRLRLGWAVAELRHVAGSAPGAAGVDAGRVDAGGSGEGGAARGIEIIALTDGGRSAAGIRAERVIFAVPHFLTRHLIRDYRDDPPDHVAAFDYGPWMVANLTLKARPFGLGFPLAWDNVLYDSPALGYVLSTHQRLLDHGPTIITYYYPLLDSDSRAGRERLLEADWAVWADVALSDLERAHPDIRAMCQRIDVARWGHAMVRPHPGFISGPARRRAAEPYRGVHFAHSDLSGVALFEEAFDQGIRAAEEVAAARGMSVSSLR